jgi:methyl-accepting chemotaxis protein
MFGKTHDKDAGGADAVLRALDRALAIIEFDRTGKILTANANFCRAMGYELSEIRGQHHRLFVTPEFASGADYKAFWDKLGRGQYDTGEYLRLAKGGRPVWIQASYNPVLGSDGQVLKIVKVAADVTAEKLKTAEFEAKMLALTKVQAIVDYKPDGEIITCNQLLLDITGYAARQDLIGRHDRTLVDPAEAKSEDYAALWRKVNDGEYVAGAFRRFGKGGKELWLQASFNPIFDLDRKVVKVIMYATDITGLTQGLARMASKRLDQEIDTKAATVFGKLRADFNQTHQILRDTLIQVGDGAGAVRSGVEELASAADDLSRRTEQQAATLEETAAALDQITATVKQAAERADQAQAAITVANEDAAKGAVVVREAVQAMDGIAGSAGQISQIIGVIDEIAFQTNLLALNAGVEAARAGDAGRGFAVVASEVRALAQRSAEAAKEIKALISSSSAQVNSGVGLVRATGEALERIITQVSDINGVISDVAVGAREQSIGLEQVNTAINEMDRVTQQNAAMVEEATAAARSLAQEVDKFTALTSQFELGLPQAQVRAAPAQPRAARMITRDQAAPDSWEEF